MTAPRGSGRRGGLARRLPVLVLVTAVLAGVALLAGGAMQRSLTYYRTPTELVTDPPGPGQSVRVGGLVLSGTVHQHAGVVRFVLSDGAHDLDVVSHGTPPSLFRAGRGAVVQGHLAGADGSFRADEVVVRHSDEYRPPRSSAG